MALAKVRTFGSQIVELVQQILIIQGKQRELLTNNKNKSNIQNDTEEYVY